MQGQFGLAACSLCGEPTVVPALAACLLVALVGTEATDPTWSARYEVRFVADEQQPARVEVEVVLRRLPGTGSPPESVELSMADGYPGGYGRFVRGFESFTPEGARQPARGLQAEVVDAANGRFRVPLLDDGLAGFRYQVVLEHDPEQGIGWDETPHVFSDGVLWTGRSLFITAEDSTIEVVLEAPEGQHVTTSLDPLKEGLGHRAASPHDLRETYLLVGSHLERTLELGRSRILLAIDGAAAASADAIEQEVRGFFEATTAAIGGPPPARCLVAITVCDREGGGAVHGRDAHVLAMGPPPAEGDGSWRATLCHELFHLYNPRQLGFDSREMWFSEGFTEYYAHLLLARTGRIGGQDFLRTVGGWAEAYTAEAGEIGLRKAGELGNKNNSLIYQGGALAALYLDVSIRHASGNRRSLDDVLAHLWKLCGSGEGREVPVSELERILVKLGGKDLDGFLERHVEGHEVLPLAEVTQMAGLRLEQRSVQVPEMDALVQLLQAPGMTVTSQGIRIDRTSLPALQTGDVLLRAAGRAVSDFGDLRLALADLGPGDEVVVVVQREGREREIELRLAGQDQELAFQKRVLTILEPLPKPARKARAVREVLFGM